VYEKRAFIANKQFLGTKRREGRQGIATNTNRGKSQTLVCIICLKGYEKGYEMEITLN